MSAYNNCSEPGVFILDGQGHADLAVVREIGARKVPVYLASGRVSSPVRHSRYVSAVFDFPGFGAPVEHQVSALREIGAQFSERPLFLSTGDRSLSFFNEYRTSLEPFFRHDLARRELLEQVLDKRGFARLAAERGLPVPYSCAPESRADLEQHVERLKFPVMVKAATKTDWDKPSMYSVLAGNLKGVRIETEAELFRFYDSVSAVNPRVVVQDYIDGRDENIISIYGYIAPGGEVLGCSMMHKLRTWPIHRGNGCFCESAFDPAAMKLGIKVLQDIGYTGYAIVQLKLDTRDNAWKVLEINGRYGSAHGLQDASGTPFAYLAYCNTYGRTLPKMRVRPGVAYLDFAGDVQAFLQYRRVKEWTAVNWLRSLCREKTYAVLNWRDPLPLVFSSTALVKRAWQRLRKPIDAGATGQVIVPAKTAP